jgi:hypothetical protein
MDKLDQLYKSIRAAFTPSPMRIALTIILICLFVGGLATFCVIEFGQQRKRQRRRSESRYAALRDNHHLSASDEDIIGRMVATLSIVNRRHLLLTNQFLFNACARLLLKKGEVPEAIISELRGKLGFVESRRTRVPISTTPGPWAGSEHER